MPSDAKKRKKQRKKEAAKARRNEAQAAESGSERTPPTQAHGSAEGMASAPLSGIHSLSNETLFSIFSLLPIQDLARCAAVCKRWHDIVTGFNQLWEGTRYRSERSPRESLEVYAILRALPPLREVVVKNGEFCIDVKYPSLYLTVRDVPDTGSAEVGVFAQFLSEDRLDTSVGISRLQVLDIECPGLKELTFLRRYSDVLRKLELKGCVYLLSAAYAGLGQLGNLQSLRLHDCYVEAADLEVAAKGMRCLASLRLEYCDVSDLSCLRHCERLRELRVEASPPLTGLRDLPAGLRSLHLDVAAVAADELSEAAPRLPQLEELHLGACELAHLNFLCHCPNLRRLSFWHSNWPDTSQLSNLGHLVRLEVLKLVACKVDADVLSGALPSLTRLHTLSLSHAKVVAHLQFLQHCPQLRTLSLNGTVGLAEEAYQEVRHLINLQTLDVSFDVRELVRELVRPFLPNLNI